MKKTSAYISLMLLLLLLLSACALDTDKKDQPPSAVNGSAENPSEKLDTYEYNGETKTTVGDRTFELEDVPESAEEELVVNYCYYNIIGDYDSFSALYGENEALKIAAENESRNFEEGKYIKEYIIHDISTLSETETTDLLTDSIQEDVEKYNLAEYVVIHADIDMAWSEYALTLGPQLGAGRHSRLFLCGKSHADDDWKIYEIYWGEYYEL